MSQPLWRDFCAPVACQQGTPVVNPFSVRADRKGARDADRRRKDTEFQQSVAQMSALSHVARPPMVWLKCLAVLLNGFAIVTVNLWIYAAMARFMEFHAADYGRPPTISRSISDPLIGVPFQFWITVSGICLVVGVGILILNYVRALRTVIAPSAYVRVVLRVFVPLILVLQVSSSIGMYVLSAYRIPFHSEMHMVGSFQFFISQALVVLLFTLANQALLRDRNSLEVLHRRGDVHRSLVRLRFWVGSVCIALVLVYFGLFLAKDVWTSDIAPRLYWTYTKTEPVVISMFLLVLALSHLDLFRKRRE